MATHTAPYAPPVAPTLQPAAGFYQHRPGPGARIASPYAHPHPHPHHTHTVGVGLQPPPGAAPAMVVQGFHPHTGVGAGNPPHVRTMTMIPREAREVLAAGAVQQM
jgi:hypothetical protein